jgi:hypothetical protein
MAVTNDDVVARLRRAAALLEMQHADPFRVQAYRRAAATVGGLERELDRVFEDGGRDALDAVPGLGPNVAGAVAEMLTRGRWSLLERLEGEAAPEALLQSLPGVGPELARRIHAALEVETLEALELTARDGRLAEVPGIGESRAEAIHTAVADRLARLRPSRQPYVREPDVATLLDVDAEYRTAAEAERLTRIAPKRFNPAGAAWLPILHTGRGDWAFTALFSNTARAHALDRVHDWVVIYFHDGRHGEGQRTVVTEHRGGLAGRRVVRGREADCRDRARTSDAREGAVP